MEDNLRCNIAQIKHASNPYVPITPAIAALCKHIQHARIQLHQNHYQSLNTRNLHYHSEARSTKTIQHPSASRWSPAGTVPEVHRTTLRIDDYVGVVLLVVTRQMVVGLSAKHLAEWRPMSSSVCVRFRFSRGKTIVVAAAEEKSLGLQVDGNRVGWKTLIKDCVCKFQIRYASDMLLYLNW